MGLSDGADAVPSDEPMKKMTYRFHISMILLLLAGLLVSCSNDVFEDRTVDISFDGNDSKALSVCIVLEQPEDLYWSYTAAKLNGGGETGAASVPVPVSDDNGLDCEISFSVGTWNITLYGFLTEEDRTASSSVSEAESRYVYKGSVIDTLLPGDSSISLSIAPSTDSGTGKLSLDNVMYHFTLSENISETELRYRLSDSDPWITTDTGNVTVTDALGVYVGLFNTIDGNTASPIDGTERHIFVSVYRGLTTDIGGYLPADGQNNVVVSFAKNDGSGEIVSRKVVSVGKTYGQLPAAPERPGYTFVQWGVSCIPNEYQEVEYIGVETTGPYINTGYRWTTNNIKYEIEYLQFDSNNGMSGFFGSQIIGGDTNWSFNPWFASSGTSFALYVGSSRQVCNLQNTKNHKYTAVYEATSDYKWTVTVDGTEKTGTWSGTVCGNVSEVTLFSLWNGSNYTSRKAKGFNVYSFRMTDDGVLVRDLVPCIRKSDEVIGMYDLVTEQFFPNAGTGTFTKGNDIIRADSVICPTDTVTCTTDHTIPASWRGNSYTVHFDGNGGTGSMSDISCVYGEKYKLHANLFTAPSESYFAGWSTDMNADACDYSDGSSISNLTTVDGGSVTLYAVWKSIGDYSGVYQVVDYIESTQSGGQWIDTGISPEDYYTEIDFMPLGYISASYNFILGAEDASSSRRNSPLMWTSTSWAYTFRGGYGSVSGKTIEFNKRYKIYAKVFSGDHYYKDMDTDTVIYSSTATGNATDNSLAIFADGRGNGNADLNGWARLYSIKIWDKDGVLIGHYIPCYRISDEKPGVIEIVSGTFLTNSGKGADFIVGNN